MLLFKGNVVASNYTLLHPKTTQKDGFYPVLEILIEALHCVESALPHIALFHDKKINLLNLSPLGR